MFVIFLKFADKSRAAASMEAHKQWIAKGFDDGVFLVVGSLQPDAGGAILVNDLNRDEVDKRIADDPFVVEGVVQAEVHEISPARTDPRLQFLMG